MWKRLNLPVLMPRLSVQDAQQVVINAKEQCDPLSTGPIFAEVMRVCMLRVSSAVLRHLLPVKFGVQSQT